MNDFYVNIICDFVGGELVINSSNSSFH